MAMAVAMVFRQIRAVAMAATQRATAEVARAAILRAMVARAAIRRAMVARAVMRTTALARVAVIRAMELERMTLIGRRTSMDQLLLFVDSRDLFSQSPNQVLLNGLHDLLAKGTLRPEHFLHKLLMNMVANVRARHGSQVRWDDAVLEWLETLQYYGGARVLDILRGSGFETKRHLAADFSRFNLLLPSTRTLRTRKPPYTGMNGIVRSSLASFLKLAAHNNRISALLAAKSCQIFPINLQRDGLALTPGLQYDPRTKTFIGGNEAVTPALVRDHPEPDTAFTKRFLHSEANQMLAGSLCGELALPVGTDFTSKSKTGSDVAKQLLERAQQLQICQLCLEDVRTTDGVILADGADCSSECKSNFFLVSAVSHHVFRASLLRVSASVQRLPGPWSPALGSSASCMLTLHTGRLNLSSLCGHSRAHGQRGCKQSRHEDHPREAGQRLPACSVAQLRTVS